MKYNDIHKNINEFAFYMNSNKQCDISVLEKAFKDVLTIKDIKGRDTQLGMILFGLMNKGLEAKEIESLVRVALSIDNFNPRSIEIGIDKPLIYVAGSGKKGFKTFNISTPACIVAASAGAKVLKAGSSSTSSVTGSSDFYKNAIGRTVKDIKVSIESLNETGFSFFSIEESIPKFDKVYGQKMLAINALSFALPALLCEIKYDAVLYGLANPNLKLSAETLRRFGVKNATIVSSTDDNIHFIDEFGFLNNNYVLNMKNGKINDVQNIDTRKVLNLKNYLLEDIKSVNNPVENVNLGLKVLMGEGKEAHEDIIALNAAHILCLGEVVSSFKEGYLLAKETIQGKKAKEKLFEIIEFNKVKDKEGYINRYERNCI